ncbi:unnamed protein product, partial [Vitis vinifera]|uniref:Uncharacterized protein n=1 Tax=Vitis vinifera TaxID=29760 RepID=D7TS93_VITVI
MTTLSTIHSFLLFYYLFFSLWFSVYCSSWWFWIVDDHKLSDLRGNRQLYVLDCFLCNLLFFCA